MNLIARADVNGDGVIDYDEFIPVMIAMMQQKPAQTAPAKASQGGTKSSSALQAALAQVLLTTIQLAPPGTPRKQGR